MSFVAFQYDFHYVYAAWCAWASISVASGELRLTAECDSGGEIHPTHFGR